jgi:hypothetical protein
VTILQQGCVVNLPIIWKLFHSVMESLKTSCSDAQGEGKNP